MNKPVIKKYIDIDKVVKAKNPRLQKMLPRFVFNYVKRVLHQDEINDFIHRHNHKSGLDFVHAVCDEWNIETEIIGQENIPKTGRNIFVANHPWGSLDGLLFISLIEKYCGATRSIINDLLLNLENFSPLFIGVNKHGLNTRERIKLLDDAFASDYQILLFPSGLVSRRIKGEIVDLDWKKTFVTKAVKHKRDVVPIHISGRLSNFFYNLARTRKFFGLKANLEMFYLADEMYKLKNQSLTITIGRPIEYSFFDKSKMQAEWTKLMQSYVHNLPNDAKISFADYIGNKNI